MSDPISTRLRAIAELSQQHQGRPIEELLNAVLEHYPDMSIDDIQAAVRQAADLYLREADWLEAGKQDTFIDDFLGLND